MKREDRSEAFSEIILKTRNRKESETFRVSGVAGHPARCRAVRDPPLSGTVSQTSAFELSAGQGPAALEAVSACLTPGWGRSCFPFPNLVPEETAKWNLQSLWT